MQNTFNGYINMLKNDEREMYELDSSVDTSPTEMQRKEKMQNKNRTSSTISKGINMHS